MKNVKYALIYEFYNKFCPKPINSIFIRFLTKLEANSGKYIARENIFNSKYKDTDNIIFLINKEETIPFCYWS